MIHTFKDDDGELDLQLEVNRVPGAVYFEITRPGRGGDIVSLEADKVRSLRNILNTLLDELVAEDGRR